MRALPADVAEDKGLDVCSVQQLLSGEACHGGERGAFKTCTTDIYLQNECAHVGLSVHAPVPSFPLVAFLIEDAMSICCETVLITVVTYSNIYMVYTLMMWRRGV